MFVPMKDTISLPTSNCLARHAKPIFTDINGAPFKIDDRVKVTQIADFAADQHLLGKAGPVKYFEYLCGCGQSYPSDPMIGVFIGNRTYEFWKEELSLALEAPAKS
jgi:hypothetical protein